MDLPYAEAGANEMYSNREFEFSGNRNRLDMVTRLVLASFLALVVFAVALSVAQRTQSISVDAVSSDQNGIPALRSDFVGDL